MTRKQFIFIELIILGLILAILSMYITISKVIYEIRDNSIQTLRDHRTMTCTITTLDNGKNAIICYPMELDELFNINKEGISI